MKERRLEILGLLTILISGLVLASLAGYNPLEDPGISPHVQIDNRLGIMGVWIGHIFIKLSFGYASLLLPVLGIAWGWWFFSHKEFDPLSRISGYGLGVVILSSVSLGLAELIRDHSFYVYSGLFGWSMAEFIHDFLGAYGGAILLIVLWMVLIRGYFSWSFYGPIKKLKEKIQKKRDESNLISMEKTKNEEKRQHTQNLLNKIDALRKRDTDAWKSDSVSSVEQDISDEKPVENLELKEEDVVSSDEGIETPGEEGTPDLTEEKVDEEIPQEIEVNTDLEEKSDEAASSETENMIVEEMVTEEEIDLDEIKERQAPKRKYNLPAADLLATPVNIQGGMSREELVERANFLTQSLLTFGVEGKVVNVSPGPVITLFEVEPAEGVRVNKFVALSDDLARVMEASRVRVIAPIP